MTDLRLYETYDRNFTENLEDKLYKTGKEHSFSDNAVSILNKRYVKKNEMGVPQEDPKRMVARTAANIAYPDFHYENAEAAEKTAEEFYEMIINREFTPNSPTLMNAGREMQQLAACFVLPIEDRMTSIFSGVYNTSLIHQSGGGTGFSFDDLRRKNNHVTTTYGKASGPVSFIRAYDEATNAVNQGGTRRGANMGIMRVDHPDIIEFIHAKEEEKEKRYTNFNFSVALTDEFMKAVELDGYYYIKNSFKGKKDFLYVKDIQHDLTSVEQGVLSSEMELNILLGGTKVIAQYPTKRDLKERILETRKLEIGKVDEQGRIMYSAKNVFEEIVNLAWKNGEPGVLFIDEVNKHNPLPRLGEMKSTNPCGEQPLLPYEACNLGSINLSLMVNENGIDYGKLEKIVKISVHFLDNVIDMSRYDLILPDERINEIAEFTQNLLRENGIEKSYEELREIAKKELTGPINKVVRKNRKIGLGVMGFAEMLYKLKIPYNSDKALEIAETVMKFIRDKGREASRELAEKRGVFPNFKGSIYDDGNPDHRLRNATITTIAPTGTIAIFGGVTGGIEPRFRIYYEHKDADGQKRKFLNEEIILQLEQKGIDPNKILEKIKAGESLQEITEIPDDIKKIFVTSPEISGEWHIKMQATFQKYTDNAVSKTINLPNNATIDDVKNAYLLAYKLGCKGLTVYRDESREEQVLSAPKEKSLEKIIIKDGYVQPRKRPKIIPGHTIKEDTGCGNLFVTVNDDENGDLFESFATLGKAGGCTSAFSEGLARMVSYALRLGGDPKAIYGQLRGISCQKPYGFGPNSVKSCVDGFAKGMAEICKLNTEEIPDESENFETHKQEIKTENNKREEDKNKKYTSGACPLCGEALVHQEGCMGGSCINSYCGYSECS